MRVIIVICLHILGTYSITVPPVWSQNGDVTPLPVNSELFKYQSFYPSDTTPTRNINKLQYRAPNNQQFFVYHPQPTEINKPTPESYQIVHFDNQKDVLVKQKIKPKVTPIKQHLTEVSAPKNTAETEAEVPTKPIYPGEGQWAKYGQKHRPYIRQQAKEQPAEDPEDPPEGYETFKRGEEQFERAKNNFPKSPSPSKISSSESSPPEIGFIPEKLYTQVRRTESEKHLPRSAIDPEQEENAARLREVIKDSKIHTVYTEEGYEDSAYDHAGHEKKAENHEGHEKTADDQRGSTGKGSGGGRRKYSGEGGKRRGYNNERRRHENNQRLKNEDYSNSKAYRKHHDIESASSNNHGMLTIPSKYVKKVTLKNGKNEDIDMDVYTEVKYTPQKKKHKYIKITPSVKQEETSEKPLKRVKRYDKDKLSKKYIRKRPSYYWKKIKTTTSERPLMNNRRQFEAAFKTHRKTKNIEELDLEEPLEIVSTTTAKTTVSTTQNPVSSTSEPSSTIPSISKPEEFLHPDLLNPELTTRISKPAAPKALPVKIRKFKVKRQKRYTNDFPKLNVDLTEFTDVEKLTVPTQPPDLTHLKYPYYNLPISEELNENSPLRYAEDMKNIPKKVENELSFYESREHIVCPEIPSNVNPIPERVANQKEGEETNKMADAPDLPRLTGLGDKIDCLKVKYFGEDPLDSPFFQEETIDDPVPFFEIKKQENIKKISPDFIISTPRDKNTIKRELKIKILEPIVVLDEELIESATVNPIYQNTEAVLKPPYTLTEMMTMNEEKILKMNPKSIYDQITILEQDDEKTIEKDSDPPSEKFVIIYDNQDAAKNPEKINATQPKKLVSSTVKPQESIKKPQIRKRPVNVIRKLSAKTIKKPQSKITSTTTTTTTEVPTTTTTTTTTQPPPVTIKTNYKPPQTISRRPVVRTNNWQSANRGIAAFYNIFDISRFLPKVPNHRIITSEVQYKDFIKPSEQMKVYSDVLQSINNEKENKDAADSKPVAVKVSVPKDEKQNEDTPQKPQKEEIIGMLPPSGNVPYKTINQEPTTQTEITPQASKRINYYYFIGMRPPNQDRHIISKRDTSKYSKPSKKFSKVSKSERKSKIEEIEDLMMEESRFSPSVIRRSKRQTENLPQRKPKVYTEIVRQRPARPPVEDPEEEEEDLNPRKRIYEFGKSTTTSRPQVEDLEELEELEEVTEPPTTTTSKPIIYPVEANSKNSTIAEYIFFIEKLHDKWAKEDATSTTTTTTEKTVVTQTTTESVNERRGEPAYLQIINQLHEVREEVEGTTTTTTTPTPPTSEAVPIKNSNPFILETFMSELNSMKAKLDPDNTAEGTSHETARNRNYSTRFKTNIDTSKYKTIERAPVNVRHNLSSRYNSDNQELPLQKEKTTQTPMIIAIITKPQLNEPNVETSTVIPDSIKEETTNKEPELEIPSTTTVRSRQRGRPRRPSTYTTTSTTPRPSTTNPIFRRRRPSRITTTTQASTTKSDFYSNRRRARPKPIPISSTTENIVVVTPVSTFNKEDSQEDEEPKKQRRFQKVQERHVMSEVTLTRFFEPDSEEQDDTSEESKKHQYEVIGPLTNTDTLHGGNYKHEDELTTLPLFTDPNLAENVNQLKESSTEKTQASNSLLTQEEIAEKVAQKPVHSKVSLYPNMARMVNRLAEMKQEETTTEDDQTEKPTFIKDPSRRMYYYAKL